LPAAEEKEVLELGTWTLVIWGGWLKLKLLIDRVICGWMNAELQPPEIVWEIF